MAGPSRPDARHLPAARWAAGRRRAVNAPAPPAEPADACRAPRSRAPSGHGAVEIATLPRIFPPWGTARPLVPRPRARSHHPPTEVPAMRDPNRPNRRPMRPDASQYAHIGPKRGQVSPCLLLYPLPIREGPAALPGPYCAPPWRRHHGRTTGRVARGSHTVPPSSDLLPAPGGADKSAPLVPLHMSHPSKGKYVLRRAPGPHFRAPRNAIGPPTRSRPHRPPRRPRYRPSGPSP